MTAIPSGTYKHGSTLPIPGADSAKHMALRMVGMALCICFGICHDCKQPGRVGCMAGMWYPHDKLTCIYGRTATPGHSCGCMRGGGSCCVALVRQRSGLQQCRSTVSVHPCSTRALQSSTYWTQRGMQLNINGTMWLYDIHDAQARSFI